MHTVHVPGVDDKDKSGPDKNKKSNGFYAAALGIIFDTKNYDKDVTDE